MTMVRLKEMCVTAADLRRAAISRGDISTFVDLLHNTPGSPSFPYMKSLGVPVPLPEPTTLLANISAELASLVDTWIQGKTPGIHIFPEVEIVPVGLSFTDPNAGTHLKAIVDKISPEVIAIDLSPLALSMNMLYTFSLPAAIGLPLYMETIDRDDGRVYIGDKFSPNTAATSVLSMCWSGSIPLVPIGMPFIPGYMRKVADGASDSRRVQETKLLIDNPYIDENYFDLEDFTGSEAYCDIYGSERKSVENIRSEMLIEEAIYVAGRIMESAVVAQGISKNIRILAVINDKYIAQVRYAMDQLKKGIIDDETYIEPREDVPISTVDAIGRHIYRVDEREFLHTNNMRELQARFSRELEKLCDAKVQDRPNESKVDAILAEIVSRVREHPDMKRNLSVRGTIAFKEVLHGFKEIYGALTLASIGKAALTTLPHRISTTHLGYHTAREIVIDVVKEVLFGFRFFPVALNTTIDHTAEVSEETGENNRDSDVDLLDAGRDSRNKDVQCNEDSLDINGEGQNEEQSGQYTTGSLNNSGRNQGIKETVIVEQSSDFIVNEFEDGEEQRKPVNGKRSQKNRNLGKTSSAFSQLQSTVSEEELAKTLMELMDARDKQWQKQLDIRDLHVYYHVKGEQDSKKISQMKQDYYGLRAIIDYLAERGMLTSEDTTGSFSITHHAMDMLLEQLVSKILNGREIEHLIGYGKTRISSNKKATRRYRLGDVFKDISIRHTLRELARQKKQLSDISRRDIMVFIKEKQRIQSDIVLCIDSSSSMRYHQKLSFARLAASGLVKSALKKGDRIGIVSFNDLGREIIPLTEKKEEIFKHIVDLDAGGNTNIGNGVKCAADLLLKERNHNQKFIVLITDGEPTAISSEAYKRSRPGTDKTMTEEDILIETRKAMVKGIKTSVIHLRDFKTDGYKLIKNIARVGRGHVIKISSIDQLRALMA